jgi:hypothetical protein
MEFLTIKFLLTKTENCVLSSAMTAGSTAGLPQQLEREAREKPSTAGDDHGFSRSAYNFR